MEHGSHPGTHLPSHDLRPGTNPRCPSRPSKAGQGRAGRPPPAPLPTPGGSAVAEPPVLGCTEPRAHALLQKPGRAAGAGSVAPLDRNPPAAPLPPRPARAFRGLPRQTGPAFASCHPHAHVKASPEKYSFSGRGELRASEALGALSSSPRARGDGAALPAPAAPCPGPVPSAHGGPNAALGPQARLPSEVIPPATSTTGS